MKARARTDLSERVGGLRRAVEVLESVPEDLLGPQDALDRAHEVLADVGKRRELSAEHTVVALAGTTGSGKSSLANALSGVDAATVGARRPTTSHPLALVWSDPDLPAALARPLLDWLEVDQRHEIGPGTRAGSAFGADATGLVLLDLPDIDSVDVEHRRRAERLAKTVDVLVWVLDPQKYADAVVHAEFLRPMARYAEITVVVLNQVDRLAESDRSAVLDDLRARLAEDGLGSATVLATSARTGDGLDQLRTAIGDLVRKRRASAARLTADVVTAADGLQDAYQAGTPQELAGKAQRALLAALYQAARVEAVAAAVGTSYRYRARARTGWPLVRWLGRFKADPLRRMHLDRAPASADGPVVSASSLPEASPVQRAQVHTALRALGDAAAGGSHEPWRSYLRGAASVHADDLPDALDQAVVRTELDGRADPRWFRAVGAVQWLVLAVFLAGALWLGAYAVLAYLRVEVTWVPQLGPVPASPPLPALPAIPWPTVLLVGGAAIGILVSLICAGAARLGARRRSARSRAALRRSVAKVAQELVIDELRARTERVGDFVDGIALARSK